MQSKKPYVLRVVTTGGAISSFYKNLKKIKKAVSEDREIVLLTNSPGN